MVPYRFIGHPDPN